MRSHGLSDAVPTPRPVDGDSAVRNVLLLGGQIVSVGSLFIYFALFFLRPAEAAPIVQLTLALNVMLGIAIAAAAQRGFLKSAMVMITSALTLVTAVGVLGVGYGLKSTGFFLHIGIVCASALFFGARAGWLATGLGVFQVVLTYILERTGFIMAAQSDRQGSVLTTFVALTLLLVVVFIITRSFMQRNALARQLLIDESASLEATLERLEKAEKESADFFSALSHAIRTPMAGIETGLHLLKDDRVPANKRDVYLRSLRRSASDLEHFVHSLLDFKASRRGLLQTELKPCDLQKFLHDLFAQHKNNQTEKSLQWEFHLDGAEHGRFRLDRNRLAQLLGILLSNAAKYARHGDSIALSAVPLDVGADAVVWTFTVTDTGPGIDEATLSRIFQPFIQSAVDGANQTSGTGIGLALAQELAGLMGGRLQVSSHLGQGSRFWLILPLQRVVPGVAA